MHNKPWPHEATFGLLDLADFPRRLAKLRLEVDF
jgi:hypothetical protein